MTHTIEVEIDAAGNIHPVDPVTPLPKGRRSSLCKLDRTKQCSCPKQP